MRKSEEILLGKIFVWLAGVLACAINMLFIYLRSEGLLRNDLAVLVGPIFFLVLLLIRMGIMRRKRRDGTYVWDEKWRHIALRELRAAIVLFVFGIVLALVLNLFLYLNRPRPGIP